MTNATIAATFIALWAVTQIPVAPPYRWVVNVAAALVAIGFLVWGLRV